MDIKIGNRNSKKDQESLQAAHDAIVAAGAVCEPVEVDDIPEIDDTVIVQGGEVKALPGGNVGGYLVRFGDAKTLDLVGDYFDATTDFGVADKTAILYHHGLDAKIRRRSIGNGIIGRDEVGVWVEAQLDLRDEYEQMIYKMAQDDKLGWSSGTASHLVEREPAGKGYHIKSWPLGLDASMTPTPAEPRNTVITLKSLMPEAPAGVAADVATSDNTNKESTMDDLEIKQLITDTAKSAVEEYRKSEPAIKAASLIEVTTAEGDQPWENAGKFFQAVKIATLYPNQEDQRLKATKANGINEFTPADGGYLVSPQFAAGIVERMYSTGEILSRVASDPVSGNSMIYNAVDETSRAAGSRWGGIQGYWMAEAGTKTTSKPAFRQVELKLKKVAALCYATDEQLEDTANLDAWINRTVPMELKFQVENAYYRGDGVGKPLGMLASPALITYARDTASKILVGDVLGMWGRRWAGVNDYVWYVSQQAAMQLPQMSIGQVPVYLPPGGMLNGSLNGTLLGRPVIEVEYSSALNTKGDLLLAAPSQYQTITKGGVQSASSIHVAFVTDETAFRFVYRTDGTTLWNSALTPVNGADTQSPFVTLSSATTP